MFGILRECGAEFDGESRLERELRLSSVLSVLGLLAMVLGIR